MLQESETGCRFGMFVNPVVAETAERERVIFVENGAASGAGKRFVNVDAPAAAPEAGLFGGDERTRLAAWPFVKESGHQFAAGGLFYLSFR